VRLVAAGAGEGGSSRRVRARAPPLGWASWTWRRCRGCRRGRPGRERPQQRTCAFVPRCARLVACLAARAGQHVEGSPEPVGRKARGARACGVGARAELRRAPVHDHALSRVELSLSLSRLSLSLAPSLSPSSLLSIQCVFCARRVGGERCGLILVRLRASRSRGSGLLALSCAPARAVMYVTNTARLMAVPRRAARKEFAQLQCVRVRVPTPELSVTGAAARTRALVRRHPTFGHGAAPT
jgi:hypothetical protein